MSSLFLACPFSFGLACGLVLLAAFKSLPDLAVNVMSVVFIDPLCSSIFPPLASLPVAFAVVSLVDELTLSFFFLRQLKPSLKQLKMDGIFVVQGRARQADSKIFRQNC